MAKYNPDHVAQIAAMLLSGKFDAEPHHIKAAVASANALLDEVNPADEPEAEPEAPAGEASQAA